MMQDTIIDDSARRWMKMFENKEKKRRVAAAVEERYREELARAGFLGRFRLRLRKRRELMRKLEVEELASENTKNRLDS